jgi:hypothetical protein
MCGNLGRQPSLQLLVFFLEGFGLQPVLVGNTVFHVYNMYNTAGGMYLFPVQHGNAQLYLF